MQNGVFDFKNKIKDAYKRLRKLTKNFKLIYGNDWYNELHEKAIDTHNRLFTTTGLPYYVVSSNIHDCYINHCFGRDILYGLYFDSKIWKKGTVVSFSIKLFDTKDNGYEEGLFTWSIVLNNDDGFYASCFQNFGIFPLIFSPYMHVWIESQDYGLGKPIKLLSLGLSQPLIAASRYLRCCLFKGEYTIPSLLDNGVDENLKIEWDFLDWAANRIKKALREYVKIRKTKRTFQGIVMAELRALPEIGVDYFDCLQRWPK